MDAVHSRVSLQCGTYSRAIVNELRAAKHEPFSRSQGESALHTLLQVGVVAANNL